MQYLVPKLIFGCGTRSRLAEEASCFGSNAVLFHSASLERSGMLTELCGQLSDAGISVTPACISCAEEPTDILADESARTVCDANADLVIAVGGGAVMDIGKMAAALAAADYAEGVGGQQISRTPLPFIALPTTAGTGSEMTKNGVITVEGYGKRSIRSDMMLAKVAIVDPELTLSVPATTTAASGTDALCQLIECYTSKNATPYTDGISLMHIKPTYDALIAAVEDGSNLAAREVLSAGAAMSGICIANSGLGLAHGIGGVLGGICGIRHGICCGILLPHVVKANAEKGVARYADIAALFGCRDTDPTAASTFLAEKLAALNYTIGMPSDLRSFNIPQDQLHTVAKLSASSSSTRKNPVPFTEEEIYALLKKLV